MNAPITPENGNTSPSEATPNDGYELLAFTTALLLVVFIGLIPTLADANLKQLPFCLVSLAFVLGALLAYQHQHHGRFWAFIVAAIGQFFAGAEFEYMHEWRAIQFVYAAMGIALATAITLAEAVLFNSGRAREYLQLDATLKRLQPNSGRAREYLLVMGFSVGFSIFAESAATMQREQSTVAFKSTQSEVYKATIRAVDVLATTSALSPAQIKLSHLQASFTEAKQIKVSKPQWIQYRLASCA